MSAARSIHDADQTMFSGLPACQLPVKVPPLEKSAIVKPDYWESDPAVTLSGHPQSLKTQNP